jgi:hypothetical protein
MYLDPISEAIAHFIGHFSLKLEEARLREQYDEFRALQKLAQETDAIPHVKVDIQAPYKLADLDPGVIYTSPAEPISMLEVLVPISGPWFGSHWGTLQPFSGVIGDLEYGYPSFPIRYTHQIEPPGAIAVVVEQYNSLTDNDYVSLTDMAIDSIPETGAQQKLAMLVSKAENLDFVGSVKAPPGEAAIGESILSLAAMLQTLDAGATDSPEGGTIHMLHGGETAGVHVNGLVQDLMPKLSDYLPHATAEEPAEPVSHMSGAGILEPYESMLVTAGDNILVNEAILSSSWTVSPVVAVVGNVTSLNIISQINVWSDVDSIGAQFANWVSPTDMPTLAMNIASVTSRLASPEEAGAPAGPVTFPTTWAVTTITGNLVFLNWLEQVNLVSDNDVTVLTHSGANTYIETGGNLVVNDLTMLGLGNYYDLIIIGGSYYSANLISQMNVMLDNDYVGAGEGFATSGEGSLATHGNLLWNQAAIHVIGSTTFADLPAKFLEAAMGLASGDQSLIAGLLGDAAFAGLSGLRVLYISGDLLDLQYIKQTNILGDSDVLAHVAEELSPDLGGDWTEATGDNALINIATIIDAHPDATIYVGGELYSDALLYQAGLVADDLEIASGSPDQLASEAVVFLADGMIDDADQNDDMTPAPPNDGTHVDVMQTMLS